MKTVLPSQICSLATQDEQMKRRNSESDLYSQSSNLDYTDGNRAEDKRFVGSKKRSDFRVNLKFMSTLPFKEVQVSNFKDFKQAMQVSKATKQTRANKQLDSNTPYF